MRQHKEDKIGRSNLTGCTSSTSGARAVMLEPQQMLKKVEDVAALDLPSTFLRNQIHVDDLAQFGAAERAQVLQANFKQYADVFVESVQARNFKISGKFVILASDPDLGKALQIYLQKTHALQV